MQAFPLFITTRRGDISRIASRTGGEYTVDDLISESWLLATEIGRKRGWSLDLSSLEDQETVLAWLYARFVKYADKVVRSGIKLDRDWDNEDSERTGATLAALLVAPVESDPQAQHQRQDEKGELLSLVRQSYSQASAYALLLVKVDWHVEDLAKKLMLSVGGLRNKLKRIALVARIQPTLFDGREVIPSDLQARPSGRSWVRRIWGAGPIQLLLWGPPG